MSFKNIIDNLDSREINESLSRALRLSQEHELNDFENWIRLELNGYTNSNEALNENSVVPEYRSVTGRHMDRFGRPIVIADTELMFLNEVRLRNSVAELEKLSNQEGNVTIHDPNIIQFLEKHFEVKPYAFQFSSVQLLGVINSIKTRLSDFLFKYQADLKTDQDTEIVSSTDEAGELFELKPGFWGFSINLKVLARKWKKLFQKKT